MNEESNNSYEKELKTLKDNIILSISIQRVNIYVKGI